MEEISLKLFTSAFMNFQFSNSFGGNFDKKPVDKETAPDKKIEKTTK